MIEIKKHEKCIKPTVRTLRCESKKIGLISYIDYLIDSSGIFAIIGTFFSFVARLVSQSLIFRLVYSISMKIVDGFSKLFIIRFLCHEYNEKELFKNSFSASISEKFPSIKKKTKSAKLNFASTCENSWILSRFQSFFKNFPALKMKGLGIWLLFYGLCCSAVLSTRFYLSFVSSGYSFFESASAWKLFTGIFSIELMFSLLLCVLGIIAMASNSSFGQALCNSRILKPFLFKLLPLDRNAFLLKTKEQSKQSRFALCGLLLGAVSGFLNPILVFAAIIALGAVYMIMTKPETGTILLFFVLPFAPTMALAGLIIVTSIAYFVKVLKGKRTLRIELCDVLIIAFLFIILFGGLFSAGKVKSLAPAAMYICFLLAYFLIKNLICVKELVRRSVNLTVVSCALVSLYGVYQYLFTSENSKWIDTDMFTDIKSRVISTFDNPNVLGEYLILLIPIIIATVLASKKSRVRLCNLFVAALAGSCLVFTWSRGAWLGFLFSIVIFLLVLDKRTFMAFTLGIFALPFLPFVLPDSVISRFTSIGNMSDSSTSYRFFIWLGTLGLIKDHSLGGIGIGEGAFRNVYPQYSLSAIEKAPHSHSLFMQLCVEMGVFALIFYLVILIVFAQKCISFAVNHRKQDKYSSLLVIGCLAGVVAISVQGTTDYTWYNYRVYLMFWIVFALAMAAMSASKDSLPENDNYAPGNI